MERTPWIVMRAAACLLVAAIAGCGADGEPVQPTMNAHVSIGASGNVHAGGGLGLHRGPLSLYLGF